MEREKKRHKKRKRKLTTTLNGKKRKKEREKEEEEEEGERSLDRPRRGLEWCREKTMKELVVDAEMERLNFGPTEIWTGLVLHHKDVFVSHVLPKLNETDRCFFSKVNLESRGVLAYAGVDVSKLRCAVYECTSISTLEWMWNFMPCGEKDRDGNVVDQAWFCSEVVATNKHELLKWAREVKHCKWDEKTIKVAAHIGNLEMLKYCFSKDCPYDEKQACKQAAIEGHLDCLRFLFDKVKPSRETEEEAAREAAAYGHLGILKYLVEERKIPDVLKSDCMCNVAKFGQLDCLKYLVEEAKVPLNYWEDIAFSRYYDHPDCLNYLLEKGSPQPTDEQYAEFVEIERQREADRQQNSD